MKHYMAVDQYGNTHHIGATPPRAFLLNLWGRKHAERMYVDTKEGTKHIGWIVAGHWYTVYEVKRMEEPLVNTRRRRYNVK